MRKNLKVADPTYTMSKKPFTTTEMSVIAILVGVLIVIGYFHTTAVLTIAAIAVVVGGALNLHKLPDMLIAGLGKVFG
ncbi:TPA: hypothetical protein QDB06_000770 [Burkholderia vietnamiensis]|nr:hypothetical protein [Burkholderia vietnamiensis]